jgi:hypothetical protein
MLDAPWDECWTAPLGGGLYAMVTRTSYETGGGTATVYTEYLVVTDIADPGNADWSASAHVDVAAGDPRPAAPTVEEWDEHAPAWAVAG